MPVTGPTWKKVTGNVSISVLGPSTAPTDNSIARWDGPSGGLLQDSLVTISDTGTIATPGGLSVGAAGFTHFFSGHTFQFGGNGSMTLARGATNGANYFSGGTDFQNGGVVAAFGQSHGSTPSTVDILSGTTSRITINGTGLGFNGADPIAKPSASDLATLLTALDSLGLVTDAS